MFNVTIIKLKDIIKIGVILILIYVFSNFILKNFRIKNILNTSFEFNSISLIKTGIEHQSTIIKNISNDKKIDTSEKREELFDIKSILNVGSNMFSLKPSEKIDDGQDGDKKNRYRCH